MSSLRFTPVGDIKSIVGRTRAGYAKGLTRPIEKRKELLKKLAKLIDENESAITDALAQDLRKHPIEGKITEVVMCRNEIWDHYDNLDHWAKGEKAETEGIMMIEDCRIERDPFGTVLIIGAWNYPIQLTFLPLVGALAAGNTVVIKPSELSAATAQLVADLIPKYFSPDVVSVINGAVKETSAVLDEKFDKILYTGSGRVGRIIAAAAAKNLTPVCLELGGKSPCIVDEVSDLQTVAQRIVWGKSVNAGQTCIAPDYLFIKRGMKDKLYPEMKKAVKKFFGDKVIESTSYPRIVNELHYNRVKGLISQGNVVLGGETDDSQRFIAPTVVENPKMDAAIMQEEIFGPVLPVMEFDRAQEVIDYVNTNDKPLALYVFSNNSTFSENIVNNTTAGGVVVNDCLMHATVPGLPFGGVGGSGQGAYHGKHSFDLWSHQKAVMRRKLILEKTNDLRYPPYSERNYGLLTMAMGKFGPTPAWKKYSKYVVLAALSYAVYSMVLTRFI